jgi:tetratricopeptide (TPR) repeat protein
VITDKDREILDEIRFVLTGRTKSTLVVMVTETYGKRDEVKAGLDKMLPEYRSATLDLSGRSITSLFRTIRDDVSQEIQTSKPVEYLLHIFGLEDSLLSSTEGFLGTSPLIRELNLERENLFHEFPFCLIIWTTGYFTEKLKTQAPDLWDWITYSYCFKDDSITQDNRDILPLDELREGFTEERKQRIADLEKRLNDLSLTGDSVRVLRSKFTVYNALGEEYEAASRFDDAIKYYKAALAVTADSELGEMSRGSVLAKLGTACLKGRYYKDGLVALEKSLRVFEQNGKHNVLGLIFHRIGILYQEQRNWLKALENYHAALEWKEKAGMDQEMGATWHHIGRVYEEQRNWAKALESYYIALEWETKTGMEHQMGGTWHQIGNVYSQQRNWAKALESYHTALDWRTKTGMDYDKGGTWNQIGMVYEKQRNWDMALENYSTALEYQEKGGMAHQMGVTWHNIGRVYEEQRDWSRALESYQTALGWKEKTGMAQEMGSTWNHIGRVYEEQRDWLMAVECYNKALDWYRKSGMDHYAGVTWHNIGRAYEEQRDWVKALESYKTAIEWHEKTGMEHEKGGTWYHIGKIHEERGDIIEALKYFLLTLQCFVREKWEDEQKIIIESINRILPQLSFDQRLTLKETLSEDIYQLIETGINTES